MLGFCSNSSNGINASVCHTYFIWVSFVWANEKKVNEKTKQIAEWNHMKKKNSNQIFFEFCSFTFWIHDSERKIRYRKKKQELLSSDKRFSFINWPLFSYEKRLCKWLIYRYEPHVFFYGFRFVFECDESEWKNHVCNFIIQWGWSVVFSVFFFLLF